MDIKRIVLNEVSYFGPGARSILPEEIKRRGFKKLKFYMKLSNITTYKMNILKIFCKIILVRI